MVFKHREGIFSTSLSNMFYFCGVCVVYLSQHTSEGVFIYFFRKLILLTQHRISCYSNNERGRTFIISQFQLEIMHLNYK